MTNLLLRIFVPNFHSPDAPGVRSAVGTLSGAVGIAVNLLLFGAKLLRTIIGIFASAAGEMLSWCSTPAPRHEYSCACR